MGLHNFKSPFAALSGFAAASASVFGKYFSSLLCVHGDPQASSPWLCLVLIICMVVSNGLVWTMFVRALRSSESTLSVTVTSAAINYCCSALFGWLLFSEQTSLLWWIGTLLVIFGVLLINSSSTNTDKKQD